MTFIERIVTNHRVIKFSDKIDHYRTRYNNTNQTNAPSAPPPPPYYNEKSDDFKYD